MLTRLFGGIERAIGAQTHHDFDDVSIRTSLPKLAWSLTVSPGGARLDAGDGVEVKDGVCFEGAWSNPGCDLRSQYRAGNLGGAYFFGSAVLSLNRRQFAFFPPTHTIDALYVLVWNDRPEVTVTNSFVWALKQSGVGFGSIAFKDLVDDIRTARSGIISYKIYLLSTKKCSVLQMIYTPFVISADGTLHDWPLTLSLKRHRFTYEEYRDGILDVLAAMWQNASSGERKRPFRGIASTMSSGYDSVACTALLKSLGFRTALSLRTSRGQRDDSGSIAGREMGVDVRLFDRIGGKLEYQGANGDYYLRLRDLREATTSPLAEFIAPLTSHGDVIFGAFEPELASSVLLTGFFGNYVWDFNCPTDPWVERGGTPGTALGEYRLRVGFVHVPAPYILSRESRAIRRLTQSREMRPFSYGNPYNRPIARRLGEEAGASRESFGMKKKAANVMLLVGRQDLVVSLEEIAARYG